MVCTKPILIFPLHLSIRSQFVVSQSESVTARKYNSSFKTFQTNLEHMPEAMNRTTRVHIAKVMHHKLWLGRNEKAPKNQN